MDNVLPQITAKQLTADTQYGCFNGVFGLFRVLSLMCFKPPTTVSLTLGIWFSQT